MNNECQATGNGTGLGGLGEALLPLPGSLTPAAASWSVSNVNRASWQNPFKFLLQHCKPQCEAVY